MMMSYLIVQLNMEKNNNMLNIIAVIIIAIIFFIIGYVVKQKEINNDK